MRVWRSRFLFQIGADDGGKAGAGFGKLLAHRGLRLGLVVR